MTSSKRGHQRYFVVRLSDDDPERAQGFECEIQILDARGRGQSVGYLPDGAETVEIGGKVVPPAVIKAARRQAEGQGDYVDEEGNTLAPF